LGELLLARSWVLEEIEYQVSLRLLEEDVHDSSFLDSWTLVRIVAFVEPMTSRHNAMFSFQSVEMVLYDTHREVEFSFDLSKVGAWICLDELQYADSFGVLYLYNLGRLRLGTLQTYSYCWGEKCLGGALKGSSRTIFEGRRESPFAPMRGKRKERRGVGVCCYIPPVDWNSANTFPSGSLRTAK